MILVCDLHSRQQMLAMLDRATGVVVKVTLKHEGNKVREFYSMPPRPVRVVIEATGSMQWFVNLMEELGIECLVGHPATIRAAEPPTGTVLNTGVRDICHRLRISGASLYELGALETLVTHALSLILAGEDIRMRARRRQR